MTRPEFHFTAPSGWINDPHGITYRDGRYHLFYQYVPESLVWAPNCHWGHATGPDLFDWTVQPVALAPGDGDDGIWTGSLVTDDAGESTIFYTSVVQPGIGIGRVRRAHPADPEWLTWAKEGVVATAPAELDIIAYRDPFVFRDGEGWRMFVGAGLADGTATALSYSSADLAEWSYDGIAVQRSTTETQPVWTGALWECPQLFELDGRHVMVTSVWDDDVLHYVIYAVGDYVDGNFTPTSWGRLSYGPSYYAPSFFRDADGKPSLTFWLRHVEDRDAGWASAHSIPHTLSLVGETLVATPHAGLEKYRREVTTSRIAGLAADCSWQPAPGGHFSVASGPTVLASLVFDGEGLRIQQGSESWPMPFSDGPVRIIVDGPTLEVSTDGGVFAVPVAPAADSLEIAASEPVKIWQLAR